MWLVRAGTGPLEATLATIARTKGPLLITSTGERLTRQHAGKLIKRIRHRRPYPLGKMTAAKRTPRTLGVNAQTLSHWRSQGLLRARELHSDQLQPGRENAAPLMEVGAAPMLVCANDDLVAVRARPVD